MIVISRKVQQLESVTLHMFFINVEIDVLTVIGIYLLTAFLNCNMNIFVKEQMNKINRL